MSFLSNLLSTIRAKPVGLAAAALPPVALLPQTQMRPVQVRPSPCIYSGSQDIIMLLDRSESMELADYPPSRLAAGVECIAEFADTRRMRFPDDRLGVVVFNGSAGIVSPLAPLRHALELNDHLKHIRPDGMTDMINGLATARRALDPAAQPGQSTIIMLTDGLHTGISSPVWFAEDLKASGVRLLAIGIGGSPSKVFSKNLLSMVSLLEDGTPGYRFIGNKDELLACYQSMAETRLVRW